MGLFRRNGPVVFERHAYGRRRKWAVPNWLLLLLAGIALGVGGLFYVQEQHLPPRLTPEESTRLQSRVGELEGDRQRLQAALLKATAEAKAARADVERLGGELAAARESTGRLQKDLALFDEVLPPDPRGGAIGVRGARFANERGQLAYHVLVTRDRDGKRPFKGVMELVVAGERASGRSETITLEPVDASFTGYQHLKGALPLPDGFAARQVTIRVLDRAGGTLHGMRVFNVR
jgi:hypothetical protein